MDQLILYPESIKKSEVKSFDNSAKLFAINSDNSDL